MFSKLKNIFLYLGVDRDSYILVSKDIDRINRTMVVVFSGLATLLMGAMCILSVFLSSIALNRTVYICGFLGSLLLFLLSFFYAKNHSWIIIPLVYISFSIFLLYGIFIGTITNPSQQTVTFMVMLVFLPVLFVDRSIRTIIVMLLYVIVFIVLCTKRKTGGVLSTDIMDAVIYSILGATSGTIINHIKVRRYMLEHILQDAWRYDQLTRMNNRNSFEADLPSYPKKCTDSMSCVYMDVNGLHELNNTQGHLMGDIMLQYIAEQIVDIFGIESSYRIGGDEFIAFVSDCPLMKLEEDIKKLTEKVEKQGYHVAVGSDSMTKTELDMDNLIKSAETKMYQNKISYYKDQTRDRRLRD